MRLYSPSLRRTPDWQIGCIDSKWRWIAAWGIFGVVGETVALVCSTPWICGFIERHTFYEFRLKLAGHSSVLMPEATVVRIRSNRDIQVGEAMLDVAPPKIETDDEWLRRQLEWKQELIRNQNIRTAVRREIKKLPAAPTIVVCVDPQVSLETIAIVWTSIQAASKATLYLEVVVTEQNDDP